MVKRLFVLLLLIASATLSHAQVAPAGGGPALQVVRFSWAKYRPSRLSLDTGLPRADSGPGERLEDLRLQRQIAVERRRQPQDRGYPVENLEERQARRQRRLPEPGGSAKSSDAAARGGGYRYTVELQNDAQKKVQVVEWDYLFVEPGTNKELLRHRFTSKVGIEAGKRKKVTAESGAPPYGVVDVKAMSEEKAGEKVEIKRVVYADGTVWEK